MSSLQTRTEDACAQLVRYSGSVENDNLADLLDYLTDMNDDFYHGRHPKIIMEKIAKMKDVLDKIATELREYEND